MKRYVFPILLAQGILAVLLCSSAAAAEPTLTTMVHFDGTNGYLPCCGLIEGRDGNLYGTLGYGGWFDLGTAYRVGLDGKCGVTV